MVRWVIFIVLAAVWLVSGPTWAAPAPSPSVAFCYAPDPPLDELKAFDVAVVDPAHVKDPLPYGSGPSRLFAYVSVGEVPAGHDYGAPLDPAWLIGENKAWKSRVVDVSNPAWRQFFLERVLEPLWQAGYRGFFLDTLDSHQLAARPEQLPAMREGLVELIRAIKQRHPEAQLLLNRGFEILPQVRELVWGVAAESLFRTFDPLTGSYGTVKEQDRQWLIERLKEVRGFGLPAIVIDYLPPAERAVMRETATRIRELGFCPWVTDKGLAGLGVGLVEVLPRRILGIYDGAEGNGDPFFTNLQRYVVMPLNHLGYMVEMHDLRAPLPEGVLAGRYAGAVIWPNATQSGEQRGLRPWVKARVAEGLPLVFLERFGLTLDNELARLLGVEPVHFTRLTPPLRVTLKDPAVGFEQQPLPRIDSFLPLKLQHGTPLLQVASANGIASDSIAVTPWGGYVAGPYVVTQLLGDQTAWVIDPFSFFRSALRLPEMPVPDTTTENGVRLLFSHVDGDGFESRSEWPGGRLAAEELSRQILERYRLPVTVSLITSTVAPNGLYPQRSPQLESIARRILALPWVEGASHSFSHPFRWKQHQDNTGVENEGWQTVTVPGYVFDLEAEISGSLAYINQRLMPAGKRARIFQWTGNCLPGEDALGMAYRGGMLNINGGDTMLNESNRTLTAVAPLGLARGPWFQVFAPNQNENVYTGLWTGTFYGQRRVIEAFRLTDAPRRLKPVNIYYHFYSATKQASLKALQEVHEWALAQHLFGIHTADYIEKVLDFNRTVVARNASGWLVRNGGKLRELRLPLQAGYPLLDRDSRLAGFNDHGDSRYLHMQPGGEALVRLTDQAPTTPYLESAGGILESLERGQGNLRLTLRGLTPFRVRLGGAHGCRLDGSGTPATTIIDLPEGHHALAVTCP